MPAWLEISKHFWNSSSDYSQTWENPCSFIRVFISGKNVKCCKVPNLADKADAPIFIVKEKFVRPNLLRTALSSLISTSSNNDLQTPKSSLIFQILLLSFDFIYHWDTEDFFIVVSPYVLCKFYSILVWQYKYKPSRDIWSNCKTKSTLNLDKYSGV